MRRRDLSEFTMADVVFLALTLAFFVLSAGFIVALDRM